MFLGDHWIGTEPFGEYFKEVGVDAVVGSVGNGATLRLISDIPGVKYAEGRFLPYFFPDVFPRGRRSDQGGQDKLVTARRAILKKPVDRIGYGGYLKLALQFPDFIQYIEDICNEFRLLYENVGGQQPYSHFYSRRFKQLGQAALMGHAYGGACDSYKQTYSYAGVLESLSGMPFDVKFISFDEVIENPAVLDDCKVISQCGDAYNSAKRRQLLGKSCVVLRHQSVCRKGRRLIGVGGAKRVPASGTLFCARKCAGRG